MRDGKEIAAHAFDPSKKGTGLALFVYLDGSGRHPRSLRGALANGDPREFRGKLLFTEPVFRHDRA
jgi:hypothetical protein